MIRRDIARIEQSNVHEGDLTDWSRMEARDRTNGARQLAFIRGKYETNDS